MRGSVFRMFSGPLPEAASQEESYLGFQVALGLVSHMELGFAMFLLCSATIASQPRAFFQNVPLWSFLR